LSTVYLLRGGGVVYINVVWAFLVGLLSIVFVGIFETKCNLARKDARATKGL
jgi:hypothetical protein